MSDAEQIGWDRPILVARPTGRGETLSQLLAADGFTVEHRPLIELVLVGQEESSGADLLRDLTDLDAGTFTHLVVTSRTTVEALLAAAPALLVPASTRVIAVGEGTASALAAAGITAHVVAGGSGAALVAEMAPPADESLVWFPASAAASATVREGLEAKGYRVHQTTVYRPRASDLPAEVTEGLPTGRYGALVLTSPMIARRAAQIGVHPSTPVVSIGGPTSEGARAAGLTVTAQATTTDDDALAGAVRQVVQPAARQAVQAAAPPSPD